MAYFGKCTYSTVTSGGLLDFPLVYWGSMPTPCSSTRLSLEYCSSTFHYSLVGSNKYSACWRSESRHSDIIDGTILLVSKLCFIVFCFLILWLLSPLGALSPVVSSSPLLYKPSAQHVNAVCVNKRYISI